MTDNDIIKAWEDCRFQDPIQDCTDCPLCDRQEHCGLFFRRFAIDLINRKDAEIERLERSVEMWSEDAKCHFNARQTAKAEAVKEFAERFKSKAWVDKTLLGYPYYNISFRTFNNLVKEMVGDNNA